MGGQEQHQLPNQHEQSDGRRDRPRIYVASLADYNAGRLHEYYESTDDVPVVTSKRYLVPA